MDARTGALILYWETMNIDNLFHYVNLFHSAILETKNELSIDFHFFPTGSCRTTCTLLGTFLIQKGFCDLIIQIGEKYYLKNNYEQEYTHAWLKAKNSLIIDITAYQFPEISEKIIIQETPLWYNSWTIVEEISDFNIFNIASTTSLDIINYETIITKIQQLEEI